MPLYEHIILTIPQFPTASLVNIFRKYGKAIIDNKGNLRGIQNHGIRPLPARTTK